jgi:CHAD domain-containing protein
MKPVLNQEAKTFGDWAYLAIAKHYDKFLKHEAEVLKDEDPEELHQMRVGMRRLRSAAVGFSLALDLPKNAGEKRVGKAARVLGTLRDIDVLEDALKTQYLPELSGKEQKQLEQALTALAEQRREAFKEVKTLLEGKYYATLKKAFKNWLDRPTYQMIAAIAIDNILPDLLLPQISRLLLHPGWIVGVKFTGGEMQFADGLSEKEIEALLEERGYILHDLRKEAKRSRYNLELFTQFYGDAYQNHISIIKEIQTVLGDIQDCHILAEFLADVFTENIREKMPALSSKLRATRYQKWQEWESLQRKFLDSQTRKDLHLTILKPEYSESFPTLPPTP